MNDIPFVVVLGFEVIIISVMLVSKWSAMNGIPFGVAVSFIMTAVLELITRLLDSTMVLQVSPVMCSC